MGCDVKLIWHADGLWEAEWLRDILGGLIDEEITDLSLTCFEDDSIHVISSNWKPLPSYTAYARACRSRCKRIILLHLSDEYFSGGYAIYQYFDGVIRNFHTALADADGILTIPEGYSNGTPASQAVKAAQLRRYAWSFAGEIKASRIEMAAALEGFGPHFLNRTASISDAAGPKLSKPQYNALLADTVFAPCPMGNVILETWRLYESLELGCIPLVERRHQLDYFTRLFGPHPIPAFTGWRDARAFAEALFDDKAALRARQAEIGHWWMAQKAGTRVRVKELVDSDHAASLRRFAARPVNNLRILFEPLRIAALLRHQTVSSLARRLSRPAAPLRRILSEKLAPHMQKPE